MATFYLDENISHDVVSFIHAAGHHAVTTHDRQRNRARDDEQLFFARQNGWILVTHNGRDFALIHDALHRWATVWEVTNLQAGILVTPDGLQPREEAQILDVFTASELPAANMLYSWRPVGEWIRR